MVMEIYVLSLYVYTRLFYMCEGVDCVTVAKINHYRYQYGYRCGYRYPIDEIRYVGPLSGAGDDERRRNHKQNLRSGKRNIEVEKVRDSISKVKDLLKEV